MKTRAQDVGKSILGILSYGHLKFSKYCWRQMERGIELKFGMVVTTTFRNHMINKNYLSYNLID